MAVPEATLRADLYAIVDRVRETGLPVVIERNGDRIRLEPG